MFYIHQTTCISHQPTFAEADLENLRASNNNQIEAIEPAYKGLSPGIARHMGKALRMGVGGALPLLTDNKVDGIIIATSDGGIDDSIKFLTQIIDYDEGRLTPTNFVQSTFNAIAGQLGMITKNTGYNATHVHRGLAFENAMLDAAILLRENPEHAYLIGGVDEISGRNVRIETLAGCKEEPTLNTQVYESNSVGVLPGEGSAMFVVNNKPENAAARLVALKLLSNENEKVVVEQLKLFLQENTAGNKIDLLLSGENGDSRFQKYYDACENVIDKSATVARFKHITGEFQTSSALALWLAARFIQHPVLPQHMIKRRGENESIERILVYNNYRGAQHSFMLLSRA